MLKPYADQGSYTDCFFTELPGQHSLEQFAINFYTSWLFKLERWILAKAIDKPSSDADAHSLMQEKSDIFSAWKVEARAPGQILMCDFRAKTRHWLLVEQTVKDNTDQTRFYFGSAVVQSDSDSASQKLVFSSLLWFHKIYSVALLRCARQRLQAVTR